MKLSFSALMALFCGLSVADAAFAAPAEISALSGRKISVYDACRFDTKGGDFKDNNLALCDLGDKNHGLEIPLEFACVYPKFRMQTICDYVESNLPVLPYTEGVAWSANLTKLQGSLPQDVMNHFVEADANKKYNLDVVCDLLNFEHHDRLLCARFTNNLIVAPYHGTGLSWNFTIKFDTASANLTNERELRMKLEIESTLVKLLRKIKGQGLDPSQGTIILERAYVTGRADSRGAYAYNYELSKSRAKVIESTFRNYVQYKLYPQLKLNGTTDRIHLIFEGESEAPEIKAWECQDVVEVCSRGLLVVDKETGLDECLVDRTTARWVLPKIEVVPKPNNQCLSKEREAHVGLRFYFKPN